ncbi:MAG: hypothetical protein ACK4UQ_01360 [Brevundimonas sp.]
MIGPSEAEPELVERLFDASSTSAHIALARTVYDTPATTDPDHWNWKHGTPPCGPSEVVALRSGDRLVGRTLRTRKPFRLAADTVIEGATIADFVIDPAYRRADRTVRVIRAGSRLEGEGIILHGSNEMSDPLYRKLFKYPLVFELKSAVFPLRLRGALSKVTGRDLGFLDVLTIPWRLLARAVGAIAAKLCGVQVTEGLPSDPEVEAMLQAFRSGAGPHFERDLAFINWRFRTGPLFNARLYSIRVHGVFRGYLAMRAVEVDGFRFEVVVDAAHDLTLSAGQLLAVRLAMIGRAARTSADGVFVMANFGNPVLRKLFGAPLIPVPDRALKHPTPIFAHVRIDRENRLKALGRTFMTLADIDYL